MLQVLAACLLSFSLAAVPARADHVHHLWYNNATWQDADLTAITGQYGTAASFGALAAFRTTPNNQLHVYYVDMNSHDVHQLYFNNKIWNDEDLTLEAGGIAASPYGLSGFAIGNLQYVFYVGSDTHMHMLSYNNINWGDHDITSAAGGNTASAAPLVAFATKPNNQFHVYYQDLNSLDLYQLYFNGSTWSHEDLTSEIGGAYCYAQWISGYAVGNEQHLFCPGYPSYSNNLNMLHIYYNNRNWTYEDITDHTINGSGTPLRLGTGVAAFRDLKGETNVFGFTTDTQLHWYAQTPTTGWYDLTDFVTPKDNQYGGMVAFETTPNNQYHVYYAPNSEVYQLYNNGSGWSSQDLTGGAGNADPNSGMAGFAIGNLQHVFYMSVN
jgi:hypothetical protein